MKPFSPLCPASRRGIALAELLAVVSLVAILVALLSPVVGQAMAAAKQTKGVANLRQIGSAARLYAADHQGLLPYAYYEDKYHYSLALSGYVASSKMTYGTTTTEINPIFQDPSAAINKAKCHYSAHPLLMPSVSKNGAASTPQTRINQIARPASLVLLADGCQDPSTGSVSATLSAVEEITTRYGAFGASPETAVPPGPNTDRKNSSGHIRWRMQGDTAAKFLFVDGHVKLLHPGELRYLNILAD